MSRETRIFEKITAALSPQSIEVVNQSHQHKHHAGDDGTGETHYDIHVVSAAFIGKNHVEKQRMINQLLKEEFDLGLHALSMSLKVPVL